MNDKEKILLLNERQINWITEIISLCDDSKDCEVYKNWLVAVMDFLITTESAYNV